MAADDGGHPEGGDADPQRDHEAGRRLDLARLAGPEREQHQPDVTTPTASQPVRCSASSTRRETRAVTGSDIATSAWAR